MVAQPFHRQTLVAECSLAVLRNDFIRKSERRRATYGCAASPKGAIGTILFRKSEVKRSGPAGPFPRVRKEKVDDILCYCVLPVEQHCRPRSLHGSSSIFSAGKASVAVQWIC